MDYTLEELINIFLLKSEQLEAEVKEKSDLRNLTVKQLYCIELIQQMNNPNLSELAEKLKITKPTMTVMADRLEENSYITKVKSDNDRRSAHIHLTPKGRKAAQLHTVVHNRFARLLLQDLTVSESQLLRVLLNKAVNSFMKRSV